MNQDQLEATVRATLTARADTVTHGPDWHAPGDVAERRARHAARWLAPLAAAAAVAAVVGSVVAVEHESSGQHVQPAIRPSSSSAPTGVSTKATSPPNPAALQPLRCTEALPASWQRAIAAGTVGTRGRQLTPVAVDGAGQVLADEASTQTTSYVGSTVPYSHDLVVVSAHGQIHPLYAAPPPATWDGRRIGTVSSEGEWVAFALQVGAASGGQGPVEIELANTATGAVRTVRPTTPTDATIVLGPLAVRGSVYWTEIEAGQGLGYGPVYRYDIATGKRTTVGRRATSGPYLADGVVAWTDNKGVVWAGRRQPVQPAGFELAAAIEKNSPLVIDGSTYAWQDLDNLLAIRAAQPGSSGTITAVPRSAGGRLAGLTPDLVWWDGAGGAWVLDLSTGAASKVTAIGSTNEGFPVIAAGHTAALTLAKDRIAVLDTARLPALHC